MNSDIDKTCYLGTDFTLVLPTVDHITDRLKMLGRRAHNYKIDISRAFRHIKVDPMDYNLLGLQWRHVYVNTCVPFGSRHSSQIFQLVSDVVRHMMRRMGHSVINYVNDYVGFGVPSDAKCSYDHLYDLLECLGLTISKKKLVPPSTSAVCLGCINVTYTHVSGKNHRTADLLSRWTNSYANIAELTALVQSPIWVQVGLEALEIDAKI